jgi:hypothetical protein
VHQDEQLSDSCPFEKVTASHHDVVDSKSPELGEQLGRMGTSMRRVEGPCGAVVRHRLGFLPGADCSGAAVNAKHMPW